MAIESTELQAQPETEGRLPWHRPEVQRLIVTLDTKIGLGSGGDAEHHHTIID
jgi:hypothetical protein